MAMHIHRCLSGIRTCSDISQISITISRIAAAKRARPEPGHFALLNKGEAQIDLLLSEAIYFLRAFVIVYKTKLNDRIESVFIVLLP